MRFLTLPDNPALPNKAGTRQSLVAFLNVHSPRSLVLDPAESFIFLDPRRTTPNVVVGVRFDSSQVTAPLFPGEIINIPEGSKRVFFSQLGTSTGGWAYGLFGFGTRDELPAYVNRRRMHAPFPFSVLTAGLVSALAGGPYRFSVDGVRALRVTAYPISAGGAVVDPPGAGFALTLTPVLVLPGMRTITDFDALLVDCYDAGNPAGLPYNAGDGVAHNWPDAADAIVFSPTQVVQNLTVGVSAGLVGLAVSGNAPGAGGADIMVVVEGVPRD